MCDEISKETIRNGFIKSGFKVSESSEPEINYEFSDWNELTEHLDIEGATFSDYISIDDKIATSKETHLEHNSETVSTEITISEDIEESDTDEYELESDEQCEPIKMIEALNAITTIRKFITQCDGMDGQP